MATGILCGEDTVKIVAPHGDPALSPLLPTPADPAPSDDETANNSNELVFTGDFPDAALGIQPTCTVTCVATATPHADKLRWEVTGQPGGSPVPGWHYAGAPAGGADTGEGISADAVYAGLFEQNAHFGKRKIKLTIDLPGLESESDDTDIEIFFPRDEANHPGNIGKAVADRTPNWYFYWSMTSANYGVHEYRNVARSFCDYTSGNLADPIAGIPEVNASAVAVIGNDACATSEGGAWGGASGIDYFACVCRHENQHAIDSLASWPIMWLAANDRDGGTGDWLPDDQEGRLVDGHPYRNDLVATYADTFSYHPLKPDGTREMLNDIEDYCLRRQPEWINGDANLEDWAMPGMQHKTNDDYSD